jgi:hypothetical protein
MAAKRPAGPPPIIMTSAVFRIMSTFPGVSPAKVLRKYNSYSE